MPLEPFPERIDPHKLFARNGSISSEVPLAKFQRLRHYLRNTEGLVAVDLEFDKDDHGRRVVTGSLRGTLTLRCERCLGDLYLPLDTDLEVRVMNSDEEVRALAEDMEAVAVEEGGVDLLGLVEDELILSLPTVPQHEDENCNEELNRLNAQASDNAPGAESAFAKLKELKELKELKPGKSDDGR